MPFSSDSRPLPSRGAALRRLAGEGTFAIPGAPIALAHQLAKRWLAGA